MTSLGKRVQFEEQVEEPVEPQFVVTDEMCEAQLIAALADMIANNQDDPYNAAYWQFAGEPWVYEGDTEDEEPEWDANFMKTLLKKLDLKDFK